MKKADTILPAICAEVLVQELLLGAFSCKLRQLAAKEPDSCKPGVGGVCVRI